MMIRARARGEDGAAAVEFALIVGVFAMLLFGMLEFGVAFWQVQNLRSATREAAREAAVRADTDTIYVRLIGASNGSLTSTNFPKTGMQVAPGVCTPDTSGDNVKVAINNAQLPSSVQQAFSID